MSYPRYSAYKDSGIPWIGDVPKDWEVNPVLAFANERKVKNTLGEETNVLSLSYGNIIRRDVESNFGLLPESFNTYQIVKKGNIILRLTDLQNDKKSLRVGLAKENGVITSAYLNLDFQKKVIPEYAYYLLHSYDLAKVFYSLGGGVRQSLGYDELRRVSFICPSPEEQENIVNFLKTETSKTDTLIKKNEKLISLLQEKRQAIISHAITKGTDPSAPLKNSGIEWLGDIPEHWQTKKNKFIFVLQRGYDLPVEEISDGPYPVCGSNGAIGYHEEYKVKAPAITVGRSGSVGETNYFDLNIWPHNTALYIKEFYGSHPKYIFYLLLAFDPKKLAAGSAVGTLNRNNVHAIHSPDLSFEAQKDIADYLDGETTKMDSLINKAKKQNEKLKEHRSALISAAVTGKVDVREWNKKEKAA